MLLGQTLWQLNQQKKACANGDYVTYNSLRRGDAAVRHIRNSFIIIMWQTKSYLENTLRSSKHKIRPGPLTSHNLTTTLDFGRFIFCSINRIENPNHQNIDFSSPHLEININECKQQQMFQKGESFADGETLRLQTSFRSPTQLSAPAGWRRSSLHLSKCRSQHFVYESISFCCQLSLQLWISGLLLFPSWVTVCSISASSPL